MVFNLSKSDYRGPLITLCQPKSEMKISRSSRTSKTGGKTDTVSEMVEACTGRDIIHALAQERLQSILYRA